MIPKKTYTLESREEYFLNTDCVAPASSGSIRVSHDGRYGDISGKAVAVEAATGFTFDAPLRTRAR
jgi:hypothetical protein